MAKLTYKEAYQRLQQLAEEVNTLDLSDLDKLVQITEKANKYVSVCEERINRIKEKLEKSNDNQSAE